VGSFLQKPAEQKEKQCGDGRRYGREIVTPVAAPGVGPGGKGTVYLTGVDIALSRSIPSAPFNAAETV